MSDSWRRNLYAIWFAELVAIVGFTVVLPLLPLYIAALGVRGEGETRIWAGLVFSVPSVTMAIFGPIWGALSDRYGRKPMVVRAMLSGAVLITLMGVVKNVWQLMLLRALQGMLTGTVTAATTLVATTAPRERSGYALGMLQTSIYAGASVGPLLGGVVADAFGYRTAFWITGGLLLLAALAVLLFVKEPASPQDSVSEPAVAAKSPSVWWGRVWAHLAPVLGSAPLLFVLAIRLLMRLASGLSRPTLPLFVEMIVPSSARVATITGLVSGINAVAGAVGGRELGRLGDRVGYRPILAGCALASILCYVPQSFVKQYGWLLPLQAGAGLAMGGILASVSASLATLAPEGQEGLVYGVDASVVSAANAIGPMTGSALAAWLGLRIPFLAAAVVFAVAGLVALRLLPRR